MSLQALKEAAKYASRIIDPKKNVRRSRGPTPPGVRRPSNKEESELNILEPVDPMRPEARGGWIYEHSQGYEEKIERYGQQGAQRSRRREKERGKGKTGAAWTGEYSRDPKDRTRPRPILPGITVPRDKPTIPDIQPWPSIWPVERNVDIPWSTEPHPTPVPKLEKEVPPRRFEFAQSCQETEKYLRELGLDISFCNREGSVSIRSGGGVNGNAKRFFKRRYEGVPKSGKARGR